MSSSNAAGMELQAVPVLETSRLLMRGYHVADFADYAAMGQDPNFYRYLSPGPMPTEDSWSTMLRSIGHWTLMGYGFWAIEEKASGRFIGAIGYVNRKRNIEPPIGDTPEIGWVLAPAVHGQGYATEAVAAAIAWGDAHFGHARTMCIIHPDNQPSLRLAQKFGYREYARTTYHGGPIVMLERAGRE
ncbi:GNAT family N-acetyltransferase [Hymenobacter sp. IS2118]|uniref:GNAT family N-acetyltransferase n=1 Tax=Hymenobacter sp. IS2118 TaxID=1505605 RepID=UPI001F39559A|nr:GNAT family N-acetyltransferase [Hymenobacter sp. IS2118]